MILYDHPASGNCMKARILLRQLELPYERVTVDLFKGETRTPEHFARNPDGRVPVLELDSGETIAESGAILTAPRARARPTSRPRLARTRVREWMFFEQDRIEAELAYARFLHAVRPPRADARGLREPPRARQRRARGARPRALGRPRLRRGGDYSVADIALYAYVHCAGDAGADPRGTSTSRPGSTRVEASPAS